MLLLVGGILRNEERNTVIDAALCDECVECVLDGNVERIELKVLSGQYSVALMQGN